MGLLTIIRKNRQKEREMRILFLGLDNAGKTTILKKLNGEDIQSISPTLGFNIKTFAHGKYTLNIWDVGGQRTLRPYWRNYFEQTDALVWVVDSSDRMRMEDCKHELHALLTEDRLAGASLLVFANKQDLHGSLSAAEIEQALDLGVITTHHWTIWSCSAVTGANIVEGLDWVVGDVATRLYYSSTAPPAGQTKEGQGQTQREAVSVVDA
ncbi:ADP-ribosylation factor-like protein 2 [Tephrocybe rancida]|nr:ADP-ribosylation factor-like protein 2 [Tephrocybe rancida]